MKLYVNNDCSINSVKILCSSEFFSFDVDVIKCSDTKKFQRFPVFETENGSTFFSSNAICRYLKDLKGEQIDYVTEAWLEWEATILQPSVSLLLKSAKGEAVPLSFKNSLNYLNTVLSKQSYLSSKKSAGLADIVIWANLYSLSRASLLSEATNCSYIQKWIASLNDQSALIKGFTKACGNVKVEEMKKSLLSSSSLLEPLKFFMPVEIPDFTLEVLKSESTGDAKDESSKDCDVSAEEISLAYDNWIKGKVILPTPLKKESPILPKEGEKNILITSALPYVNNIPHLGNIIGSVLSADVFARYCRLRSYNTLYICGTDEYGTATETKAIELKMTPQEICNKFNKLHIEIYDWFNISFDYFGRTTTSQQTEIAQDIFNKLHAQNLLLTETVEQLYCETCKRFLADRFVEGTCNFCLYEDARGDQCDKCGKLINAPDLINPQCKLCKTTPHMRSSKHLFLDLPKLEPVLKEKLNENIAHGQWTNTAKVIFNSWLKEGLKPRCITRDLKWGTPVPLEGFSDKVFYVWFDAPIGYLSITANYSTEWKKWWYNPDSVQLYQFMAKDNVPFHAIIFPATQIGTKDNFTIVNHLSATEYLNYEDVKFSKSRGVGVFGDDAKNTGIPSDIWRFYLLYLRPEGQDTFFSWSDLMLKNNSELLNNLGNFINRGLAFISNSFAGIIPEMVLEDGEKLLIAQVNQELKSYISFMEKTRFRDAIKHILNISRIGNQYIQSNKPWELVKGSPAQKAISGTVIGLSVNVSCLLCSLIEPFMPDTAANLKLQLNTDSSHHVVAENFVCLLPPGHKIGKPVPLFKKLEQDTVNELKVKYAGKQSPERTVSPEKSKAKKATGDAPVISASNGVDPEEIESLNSLVTTQGNKVRELKANKANKSEIDEEVATLLELKRRLAIAKGENPDQPQGKSKSKKKR